MLWNSNICNPVLSHAVLVCDTLHTVYLLRVKCSIDVKNLPFYGCGRFSRLFGKLGKFSYFGTADVKEIIWTERVENCSHKKMGKLRKKSFVCMGFHMMILQRQRKNQLVIEAVQYCLLFRKMVKLICWRGLTPWTWKRIPNFWSTEKLMIYRR